MSIGVQRLYFKVIILFPLLTLFTAYFEPINKLLFGMLALLQVFLICRKFKKKYVLIFIAAGIVYIFTLLSTSEVLNNTNELFYFPFFILFSVHMAHNMNSLYRYLIKDKKYVLFVVRTWTVIVLVSMFIPSSYTVEWGGAVYFGSLCKTVWRLAPTCVFIMSLAMCMMNIYKDRKLFVYTFVPMFCFYMGGSRTYLIVGLLLFFVFFYYYVRNIQNFYLSIIPLVLGLIFLIFRSSMVDKMMAVTYTMDSYFDLWGTVTSGRSIFWKADIIAFTKIPLINKLLGNGFNYIYEVNNKAFGGSVWAHNDFIQCLISHGLIGLICYMYANCSFLRIMFQNSKDKVPVLAAILVWVVNANFNMFYTYFCSMLSFPILVLAVMQGKRNFKIWTEKTNIRQNEYSDIPLR